VTLVLTPDLIFFIYAETVQSYSFSASVSKIASDLNFSGPASISGFMVHF